MIRFCGNIQFHSRPTPQIKKPNKNKTKAAAAPVAAAVDAKADNQEEKSTSSRPDDAALDTSDKTEDKNTGEKTSIHIIKIKTTGKEATEKN